MNKNESNANKRWAKAEAARLEKNARQKTAAKLFASKLEKTEDGMQSKASDPGISPEPTDQKP